MAKATLYKTEASYHEAGHIVMTYLQSGYVQGAWIWYDEERKRWFGTCKSAGMIAAAISPFNTLLTHSAGMIAATIRFPNTNHKKRPTEQDDIELYEACERDKDLDLQRIYDWVAPTFRYFWPLIKKVALKLKDEELLREDEIEEIVGRYLLAHKIKRNGFKKAQEYLISLNEVYLSQRRKKGG